MASRLTAPNKYKGKCLVCQKEVGEGAGFRVPPDKSGTGKWGVVHSAVCDTIFYTSPPTVTSVGPSATGVNVTVTGTNFTPNTTSIGPSATTRLKLPSGQGPIVTAFWPAPACPACGSDVTDDVTQFGEPARHIACRQCGHTWMATEPEPVSVLGDVPGFRDLRVSLAHQGWLAAAISGSRTQNQTFIALTAQDPTGERHKWTQMILACLSAADLLEPRAEVQELFSRVRIEVMTWLPRQED